MVGMCVPRPKGLHHLPILAHCLLKMDIAFWAGGRICEVQRAKRLHGARHGWGRLREFGKVLSKRVDVIRIIVDQEQRGDLFDEMGIIAALYEI